MTACRCGLIRLAAFRRCLTGLSFCPLPPDDEQALASL